MSVFINNMVDVWNNGATVFTAIKMNVTDTASDAASLLMDLQVGAASKFNIRKDGRINAFALNLGVMGVSYNPLLIDTGGGTFNVVRADDATINIGLGYDGTNRGVIINNTGVLSFGSSGIASPDLFLRRDAANTLAQRNGVNAQALRVYNTFTDLSNYERGNISWSSNNFVWSTENAGTGTARNLLMTSAGVISLQVQGASGPFWQIGTGGHFLAGTDNSYDIGASGANRPRNLYVAGNGTFGGNVAAGNIVASNNVEVTSNIVLGTGGAKGYIQFPSTGVITLVDSATISFGRLQFGGTTSSFPAWKRNAASMDLRLADDSAYTNLTLAALTMSAASKFSVTSGTNQRAGNATLVGGTVTVSNTTVTANTIVIITRKTSGGTIGTAITYTLSAGTSFTITSDNVLDTSTLSYFLIEVP